MRILPALLALLMAAPAAAQEICPDSTSIVATGGAPHIVLYPDGSTYSSHSTESSAHRAAVNLSSRLGVQVLVTRVAAWRVCSPAPRVDTTIVVPPPADTVVTPPPPPPPPDTVTPPPPPPVDSDLLTFSNRPAGMPVRARAVWGSSTPGFTVLNRDATARVRSEPESPSGGVLEFLYPTGFRNALDPGVAFWNGFGEAQEVFIGTVMRFSPEWLPHGNQVKLHLINIGQYGWIGLFDGCRGKPAGHWTMAMWGAQAVEWPREGDCMQNTAPLPSYTPGQWVKQEILINRVTGVIRVWIDDVLTLDASGLRFPPGLRFGEFQHVGTWGGGGGNVLRNQQFQVALTELGSR